MSTTFKRFQIFSASLFIVGLMLFSACDETTGTDPCIDVICINGDCLVSATGDPFCNCDPGFNGASCENADDPCASVTCPLNATCQVDASTNEAFCECDPGYSGPECDVLDCSTLQCFPNSTCVIDETGIFCECDFGYEGLECENEIRAKFLGTYSLSVEFTDGFVFPDMGTVTSSVSADPSTVDQFFINDFQDSFLPANQGYSLLCRTAPIDQEAKHFEIVGMPTVTYTSPVDGNTYTNRYSSVGLGSVDIESGRIILTMLIELLEGGTVISSEEVLMRLNP